ncbi:MAG: TolC family protein [Planctomycetaceae bacterium]
MRIQPHSAQRCANTTGSGFKIALFAATVLMMVPGCRIPALCCATKGPALPADYNGAKSDQNSSIVGIEEFFNEPLLTQLISGGLSQNQELKIQNQEIQIAGNQIMARRGAYLPFVNVGAGGGFFRNSRFTPAGAAEDQLTYPGGGTFPDPTPSVGLSANLFWQIDYLRQLRNARDAAIHRYWEAIETRDFLVTRIVAETAESYYELASLDRRLDYLNQTIELQQKSLEVARAQKEAARGTELGVQRFLAEVRKNESQRLVIQQRIIEVENKINFLVGRYPQAVDRQDWDFIRLDSRVLEVGMPSEILRNRRDIRAAEREVAASGLDIKVARANFYPKLAITAGVGYEAFNPRYLFDPGAFVANAAGNLVAPLINRKAIRAEYQNANARQIQAIYEYQRTVLNAFTEVVNSIAKVENYRQSVAIKEEQVKALESSVDVASGLFQAARPEVEYKDVLFAQRDLLDARTVLIETKQQQLSAIVSAYRALGGGTLMRNPDKQEVVVTELIDEVPPVPENGTEPAPMPPAQPEDAAQKQVQEKQPEEKK